MSGGWTPEGLLVILGLLAVICLGLLLIGRDDV